MLNPHSTRVLRVALTGGIGSGKSLAGKYFQELGAHVVDSDQLARDVVSANTPGFAAIVQHFGSEVLLDGQLDRKKLASIIFSDEAARAWLESIVHPLIRARFEQVAAELEISTPGDRTEILINQIPLLVESGNKYSFSKVIAIVASPSSRRSRLRERGLQDYEIDRRLAAQVSDQDRIAVADYVIANDGSQEELADQVSAIYAELLRLVKV